MWSVWLWIFPSGKVYLCCCKGTWPMQSPYIPCTKPHVLFTSLGSYQKLSLSRTQMHFFRNKAIVYSEELSVNTSPISQVEDLPLSAIRTQLSFILEVVPSSATWRRSMPWWQGRTAWYSSEQLALYVFCDNWRGFLVTFYHLGRARCWIRLRLQICNHMIRHTVRLYWRVSATWQIYELLQAPCLLIAVLFLYSYLSPLGYRNRS